MYRSFESHRFYRSECYGVVFSCRTHVGELFSLARIDVDIKVFRVLADDHSFINRHSGSDEKLAARLEIEKCVCDSFTLSVGNYRTSESDGEVAAVFFISFKKRVESSRSFRVGEELVTVADESAGGNSEFHESAFVRRVYEVCHSSFSCRKFFGDDTSEHFVAFDVNVLDGFVFFAVDLFVDNGRSADAELEAFTPHLLDDDRHLKLAAPFDDDIIVRFGLFQPDRNVHQSLFVKSLLDFSELDVFSVTPCQRTVVYRENHADCRFVDFDSRKCYRLIYRCDGVSDMDVFDSGENYDVSRLDDLCVNKLNSLIKLEFRHFKACLFVAFLDADERLVAVNAAVYDFSYRKSAEIVVVAQIGN